MLALALARYLPTVVDGLTLNEGDAGGDVFVGAMPQAPDVAESVIPTGGPTQPTKRPTSQARVQIRSRGVKHDPVTPFRTAQAISDALTCLDGVHMDPDGPDEVWVIGCDAVQSEPYPIGQDEVGRHEYAQNFDLRIHHPTAHRPALA